MDNPANPVFFNTFDPFDTPTPSNSSINKSSSLSNSQVTSPVNNVLMPSASSVNTSNPYYLSSPLDSPSINPYPLPTREPSYTSPTPSPAPPAYNNVELYIPSPPASSYSAPSTSPASAPRATSPVQSPSLSSQNGYPQLHAPSPVPQHQQPQFQVPSPTPLPQTHQPITQSPPAYFQPPSQASSQPQSQPTQSQPTQSQPQQPSPPHVQPPTQPVSFSLPASSSSSSVGAELFEQMNKNLSAVMNRLDSIENRLSNLEITTKEVLNNQRTISSQQRKLQDSVETSTKLPVMPPPQHVVYEEPRKPQPQVYPPAPVSSHVSPPAPVIMPPPTHSHMPALVPVTHISNRGEMDYKLSSSSRPSQYDADLEYAKKLQAEFDASSSASSSSTATPSSNSNTISSSATSYSSKPYQSSAVPSQPKSGQQECPICQTRVAIADLEAHVEQHFEDEEAKRAPPKPGEKPVSRTEAKAGFFAKLFGKPEDEKKPASTETPATPAPAATPPAQAVPYTHTVNQQQAAYNQRMGYYPNMAASPGRPGMYTSYYGYPVQQNMPQNMPRQAGQPQQFLYYPSLEQPPQ